MQVVQARATFVTPEAVDHSLTTIVARSVLEAALQEEEPAELWFEVARDDGDDVSRLSIDLSYSDIEELLQMSPEDEIALSLDGEAVESLFDDADVEAHGMKRRDRDRRHERRAARSRRRAGCGSAGDAAGARRR